MGYLGRILIGGLLLSAPVVEQRQALAQSPQSTAPVFPGALLEGTAHFQVAITLQGDLRGNYRPCG